MIIPIKNTFISNAIKRDIILSDRTFKPKKDISLSLKNISFSSQENSKKLNYDYSTVLFKNPKKKNLEKKLKNILLMHPFKSKFSFINLSNNFHKKESSPLKFDITNSRILPKILNYNSKVKHFNKKLTIKEDPILSNETNKENIYLIRKNSGLKTSRSSFSLIKKQRIKNVLFPHKKKIINEEKVLIRSNSNFFNNVTCNRNNIENYKKNNLFLLQANESKSPIQKERNEEGNYFKKYQKINLKNEV